MTLLVKANSNLPETETQEGWYERACTTRLGSEKDKQEFN
jgi:hypothetical protein